MNVSKILTPRMLSTLRFILHVTIIAAAIALGSAIPGIVKRLNPQEEAEKFVYEKPKTISQVSVAVNERHELMIIDRVSGTYQLFQDSVGHVIFNMYASQIYTQKTQAQ